MRLMRSIFIPGQRNVIINANKRLYIKYVNQRELESYGLNKEEMRYKKKILRLWIVM